VSTSEDKRISEKSEDTKGGNEKSLRIPKGVIRKVTNTNFRFGNVDIVHLAGKYDH
jgi:hypothetical protein